MKRTQLYLAGLLLIQIVLILIFRSPFGGAQAAYELKPLLPGLAAITPTRLSVHGGDNETLELVRQDGVWHLDKFGGFPADEKKVTELIDNLRELRVRRPVVTSSRYHEAFKVKDDQHEARIKLWSKAEGDPDVDLIVGSSPNFRTSHVRVAGQDPVFEVQGLSPYDVRPTPSGWIEKDVVGTAESEVVGLTLTNAKGSFTLEKKEGTWSASPAGPAALDPAKVDSLVRSVTALRLADATGPVDEAAQGLAQPAARIVLRLAAAPATGEGEAEKPAAPREIVVRIGAAVPGEDTKRYLTRDGFGFTGTVWDSSVKSLVEETLAGLTGGPAAG